jgi:diaminopimelate epimerase
MLINFLKYQGTGNDFILIDNREKIFSKDIGLIKHLCHRKFGIGSDGLILIEKHSRLDFEMVFYNPDGSQSFCGNGSRCAVSFAKELGLFHSKASFQAIDGVHEAEIINGLVRLQMNPVHSFEKHELGIFLDTGSPHLILERANVNEIDVVREGHTIRHQEKYHKQGVNVNFVRYSNNGLEMRTYERGVENETLSCGTGVTAAALSAGLKGLPSPVQVTTAGGILTVEFEYNNHDVFTSIFLIGPTKKKIKKKIEAKWK